MLETLNFPYEKIRILFRLGVKKIHFPKYKNFFNLIDRKFYFPKYKKKTQGGFYVIIFRARA